MQQILIIDDAPDLVATLREALEGEGYGVRDETGPYALLSAEQTATHLILLDMLMPHMSGPCMLEYLTSAPATRRIPVVVMSGLDASDQIVTGAGGAAQLPKPFDLDELLDVVRRHALPDDDAPSEGARP